MYLTFWDVTKEEKIIPLGYALLILYFYQGENVVYVRCQLQSTPRLFLFWTCREIGHSDCRSISFEEENFFWHLSVLSLNVCGYLDYAVTLQQRVTQLSLVILEVEQSYSIYVKSCYT